MKQIWIIAKRELNSFFDSLLAYILLIAFLIFTGIFTWLNFTDIFLNKQASLDSFFNIAYWTFFFFIPALTMRSIAEERNTGTLELLVTKPISDWQMIVGKYCANLLLICISLVLTIPYYITVANIGPIDHGAVITGYLGLILMSSAYVSIGIFASSLTTNQIVSFILALFIGIFFHWMFGLLSQNFSGILGEILDYLSVSKHYDSISRGVIDSRDVIFFVSLTFLGLFGSESILTKRNLSDS